MSFLEIPLLKESKTFVVTIAGNKQQLYYFFDVERNFFKKIVQT